MIVALLACVFIVAAGYVIYKIFTHKCPYRFLCRYYRPEYVNCNGEGYVNCGCFREWSVREDCHLDV